MKIIIPAPLILFFFRQLSAQDELMNLVGDEEKQTTEYATASFKASRIIQGQSIEKTFDGGAKVKFLRQSKGERNMPFSLSYYGNLGISSLKWADTSRTNYFTSRMTFVNQLLIARKFTSDLTLQLTPTFVHRNLVEKEEDQNDVWAIGAFVPSLWNSVKQIKIHLVTQRSTEESQRSTEKFKLAKLLLIHPQGVARVKVKTKGDTNGN